MLTYEKVNEIERHLIAAGRELEAAGRIHGSLGASSNLPGARLEGRNAEFHLEDSPVAYVPLEKSIRIV